MIRGFTNQQGEKIMERTNHHEAGLMAAWLATGGAIEAAGREAAEEDDGLAAFGISRSVLYCGDDGLAAGYRTGFGCYLDDGLEAGGHTISWHCADDGLRAGGRSMVTFCDLGDDGLTAGGYASTIGAFCW